MKPAAGQMASSNILKMSALGFAALAVLAMSVMPTAAQGLSKRIFVRHATTVKYSRRLDVVTAFVSNMARYRQELVARIDGSSLATTLTPARPSDEFLEWTWRSADGSLLQSVVGRGLLLIGGDCLARLCSTVDCNDAGWPAFQCSDGHRREMLVTDFKMIVFDNISYGRLSEPALAADKPADAPIRTSRAARPGS